ncbi:nectin-2-like [Protopterus annectens]|uniref:nectin-2-like n=1 Tax=Protopterus annectens TaxID=7888 RepID=UPI001CFAF653|nr:nectin-2-like [Protopterus annectens]
MICRQQRKNRMADDDDFESPPAYKPPPPQKKAETVEPVTKLDQRDEAESIPLKSVPTYFETSSSEAGGKMNYDEGGQNEYYSNSHDVQDDYVEQINPIYNDLTYPVSTSCDDGQSRGYVMSRAMYV